MSTRQASKRFKDDSFESKKTGLEVRWVFRLNKNAFIA